MYIVASFFNLAGPDVILILIVVLILFGPKKLPELARGIGQAVKEFHKAKDEIERELTRADVTVQPAVGQQPRMAAELAPSSLPPAPVAVTPLAPPPIGVSPVAQAAAPAPVQVAPAQVVEEPHHAAQA